ncbi:unnamed protein product [Adineta steineri]|uniref:Uncharacterized protein n=1 Tax=Adineta steineri TaxID=433720 RepID=A0A813PU08_9BILA|nr:unnamed protein product [Adineta steineri]
MNNQLRRECIRVLFNCWHCQKIDDCKKYSQHRSNSTTRQSMIMRNGDNIADNRESVSMASSMRRSTIRTSKIKVSTMPILDTAYV